jgi:hypothetical protein
MDPGSARHRRLSGMTCMKAIWQLLAPAAWTAPIIQIE